jgi:hypothetical protein
MAIFDNLKTTTDIEEQGDYLGGYQALKSDVYQMTIKMAYVGYSAGKAMNINFIFEDPEGKETRMTLYVTNKAENGGVNYYERDGVKHYLPGFNICNAIALLSCGKPLADLDTETKVTNIWNFDAKKEIPTKVEAFTQMHGLPIVLGILKVIDDKRAKGNDGKYYPTGETKEINEIDAVFRAKDNLTVTEIKARATEPDFIHRWVKRWKGVDKDKTDKTAAAGGAPNLDTPAAKPQKPIFTD